MENNIKGN